MNKYSVWLAGVQFLSSKFSIYGIKDERLDMANPQEFMAFYSRDFLKNKGWSVIPLWEGDLRSLLFFDQRKLDFSDAISERCRFYKEKYIYRATVEKAQPPYEAIDVLGEAEGDPSMAIAVSRISLDEGGMRNFFEPTQARMPYWGHNFIWSDGGNFLIYTNGDNAAFIAGDRFDIERMLGVSYDYCVKRFIDAGKNFKSWQRYIKPYINFCDEFSHNQAEHPVNHEDTP